MAKGVVWVAAGIVALAFCVSVIFAVWWTVGSYDSHPFRRVELTRAVGVRSLWQRGPELLIEAGRGYFYLPRPGEELREAGNRGTRIGGTLFWKGPVMGVRVAADDAKTEHDPHLTRGPRSLRFLDFDGRWVECAW